MIGIPSFPHVVFVSSQDNFQNLGGLNHVVREEVELPAELLARYLLKGETVVAQFDVFYPELRYVWHL